MQYSNPPRSSSPLPWILGCLGGCFLLGVIALVVVVALGIGMKQSNHTGDGDKGGDGQPAFNGTVMKSADGTVQIMVPNDWAPQTTLNAQAIIQAANPAKELYVVVLGQDKQGVTLDKFFEATRDEFMKNLTSPQATDPKQLTINNNQAMQSQVTGQHPGAGGANFNVAYLYTVVETPQRFYQILTWTTQADFDQNHDLMEQVTESFKEAGAAP